MEITQRLKEALSRYSSEIDKYQFANIYNDLRLGNAVDVLNVPTLTEMLFSIGIDPASYLMYIPEDYLEESEISSYQIPDNVTEIRDLAFFRCRNLTKITVPSKVVKIGDFVFGNCERLTSLTLPNSLQEIGDGLVYRCNNLETITFEGSVEQWKGIKKGLGLEWIEVRCVG